MCTLFHRAFHNYEWTQWLPRKHFPDHKTLFSSLHPSESSWRVFAFRHFTSYTSTYIWPMKHNMFIQIDLSPLGGCPFAVLGWKFSFSDAEQFCCQHNYVNQVSKAEANTAETFFKPSLRRYCYSFGAFGRFYVCTSIGPNAPSQLSFISVIYGPWCITLATFMIEPYYHAWYTLTTMTCKKFTKLSVSEIFSPLVWMSMIMCFWKSDKLLCLCITQTITKFSDYLVHPL